jgi:hypothetical protein
MLTLTSPTFFGHGGQDFPLTQLLALSTKAVLPFRDAFSPEVKQNLMQKCCSYQSATKKQQIALNTHNNKQQSQVTQLVVAENSLD